VCRRFFGFCCVCFFCFFFVWCVRWCVWFCCFFLVVFFFVVFFFGGTIHRRCRESPLVYSFVFSSAYPLGPFPFQRVFSFLTLPGLDLLFVPFLGLDLKSSGFSRVSKRSPRWCKVHRHPRLPPFSNLLLRSCLRIVLIFLCFPFFTDLGKAITVSCRQCYTDLPYASGDLDVFF